MSTTQSTQPCSFVSRELANVVDLTQFYEYWPQRYPCALVSTARQLAGTTGKAQARYSILFACPQQTLRLDKHFSLHGCELHQRNNDFLNSFNSWFSAQQVQLKDSELPFTGGWFVYLAYELAQQIEPRLTLPGFADEQPIACATRFPAAIIVDHQQHSVCIVVEKEFEQLLDEIEQDYRFVCENTDVQSPVTALKHCAEDDEQVYLQQVARLKQYIVEGDVFQANLSRRWQLAIEQHTKDRDIFNALAKSNPASFAALVKFDHFSIISSSPERLVSVRNKQVETRPIAGTRPRADNISEDGQISKELLNHPKERAEHIMLIDLERNDLGRICTPGSIHVDELLILESWQHVHHIVSNIRGKIRDDVLPGDVLRAVFPGGTITGCPKVRCMEILAEQEQQARGVYTGSLGYINRDGSMDFNILIRSITRQHGNITFRAGGGIVADSHASAELAETRAKAKGLLAAFR